MLTVDPEKDVRDEAFKTIKQYLQKLEKVSEQPELVLEMEKDVQACALDLKNETSWTSWAVNSLSSKMSNYKNKSVQPSVALNTQPLGPPPGLETKSTGEKKPDTLPSSNAGASSPKAKPQDQQKATQPSKTVQEESSLSYKPVNLNVEKRDGGWAYDDDENDEWKDLDDEDQMEPLESAFQSSNFQTSNKASKTNDTSSGTGSNNDWSTDWTNSFEEIDKGSKPKSNNQEFPSASSYFTNPIKNEEDLFTSLVKDININNKVY